MLPNIGVVGRKRAGKDTIADHLVQNYGYVRVGLADPVKELALVLDPIVHAEGETGYDHGYGGELVTFPTARTVHLSEIIAVRGWERAKDEIPEVRRVLQAFGTDVVRKRFGDSAWIDLALAKVRELNAQCVPAVLPDVRFPNEGKALGLAASARLIRVTRPGLSTTDNHDSERHTDTIPVDVELSNEGTVQDLLKRVDDVLGAIERNAA